MKKFKKILFDGGLLKKQMQLFNCAAGKAPQLKYFLIAPRWHSKKESNLYKAGQSRLHSPLCYCCIWLPSVRAVKRLSALPLLKGDVTQPMPPFAGVRNRTESGPQRRAPASPAYCRASVRAVKRLFRFVKGGKEEHGPRIADRPAKQQLAAPALFFLSMQYSRNSLPRDRQTPSKVPGPVALKQAVLFGPFRILL